MKKAIPYILITVGLLLIGGIYLQLRSSGQPLLPSRSDNKGASNEVSDTKQADLKNLGPAPEFTGIEKWLNSDAQTIKGLKGKVVLVDFWTYSCINCIRTLPYVTKWYDTYKDKGLVVVGVHTPEFAFEKVTANVQMAIDQYKIHYPVAQDNNYKTWIAYSNQFWPAEYLIDQNGNIVYTHFGEGHYDITENAIRQLLGLNGGAQVAEQNPNGQDLSGVQSPEMYFGLARQEFMANRSQASDQTRRYTLPSSLPVNTFALGGSWDLDQEKAALTSKNGVIRLRFNSGKVYMVAQSDQPITVKIKVDGKETNPVTINSSQLYTLFNSTDYREHTLEITIPQPGLNVFTFTFG